MIFINTRPLDEGIHGDRRPSKAPSHHSAHSEPKKIHMSKVAVCLLVFYLLVSVIPVLLHYPLSLVSLFVPGIVFLYAICTLRSESKSDHWPCCLVAIVGILIKIAAIVIYIVIFPVKDAEKKHSNLPVRLQVRADVTMNQYRMIFFVVLIALEIFVLMVGVCLKWHLTAFERIDNNAQKRSFQRTTTTSTHPLISGDPGRRTSTA
ncbi:hypothetical protein ANCCAN_07520 [Ancylostoma caninum]|uniref:Uncharacterized protein n=1 Tax=Ancylostoma caninum TaxID=29170 RepID=A0A368GPX4_ANCCA|nr:hypothetical protein ANCCAN_07520 [Ancylostoma caninum]